MTNTVFSSDSKIPRIVSSIVAGPSKQGLQDALFQRDQQNRLGVRFETGDVRRYDVVVNAVEREDGSGESWNIRCIAFEVFPGGQKSLNGRPAQIHFYTNSRKGSMYFLA